jgi:hypothetical protein
VTLHQDGLHHGVDCNAARAWKIYIYIYRRGLRQHIFGRRVWKLFVIS